MSLRCRALLNRIAVRHRNGLRSQVVAGKEEPLLVEEYDDGEQGYEEDVLLDAASVSPPDGRRAANPTLGRYGLEIPFSVRGGHRWWRPAPSSGPAAPVPAPVPAPLRAPIPTLLHPKKLSPFGPLTEHPCWTSPGSPEHVVELAS